jgi:hypothetical protein
MTQISEGSGKLSVDFIGGLGGHVGAVGPMACVLALAMPWSPWVIRTRRAQTSAFWIWPWLTIGASRGLNEREDAGLDRLGKAIPRCHNAG